MSIKKGISYNSPVWAGDSSIHQNMCFSGPYHRTLIIPESHVRAGE
jgi:hypothetical protein